MTTIETNILLLAQHQQRAAEAKEHMKKLQDELEASENWKYWAKLLGEANKQVCKVDNSLRKNVIATYEETGEKKPHPACGVRLTTKMRYVDADAITWCRENLPAALSLNRRLFEKHAKGVAETAPIPGVAFIKEPKATIAKDLSVYLKDQEAIDNFNFDKVEAIPF